MHPTIALAANCPLMIVMVNYKTAHLAINCLRSLVGEIQTLPGTRMFIVENDSGADQIEKIQAAIVTEGWSEWATIIPSDKNGGYAYGNNFVIRPALQLPNAPPYFLLLNPDTAVHPGALKALIEFMDHHPKVGIGGSSFENADGSPWPITFRFPTIMSELDSSLRLGIISKLLSRWIISRQMEGKEEPVDWLPGASMIIRRQVFDSIGLMDEGYFLYYEETDFCLQAKRAGWGCWYIPKSRVMHIAGQSTGVTVRNVRPKRIPAYWYNSRRRYFVKNHGFLYAALADITWTIGCILWKIRQFVQRKPNNDPPKFLSDFLLNSVFIKGWQI